MPIFGNHTLRSIALAGVAVLAIAAQPAYAATSTSNLSVDATVTANCDVTTAAVSFGDVNVLSGANVDGTGDVSVTCTSGTAWAASAGLGSGTGASLDSRKMMSGSDLLSYSLYTDSARSSVWGDGVGGTSSMFSGTGSGSAQANVIYARVPSGQISAPAGSYADTVVVTVTY